MHATSPPQFTINYSRHLSPVLCSVTDKLTNAMKSSTYCSLLITAFVAQYSEAFQPSVTRRAVFQKLATTTVGGGLVASSVVLPPGVASAAEPKKKKKEMLRGGKDMSDALHNGTDLNGGEAAVASGLLDKMGLNDITPDKGTNSRAPPTAKKSR